MAALVAMEAEAEAGAEEETAEEARVVGTVAEQAVEKEVGRFSQRRTNLMYVKWVKALRGESLLGESPVYKVVYTHIV